jgi:hypothetical protein
VPSDLSGLPNVGAIVNPVADPALSILGIEQPQTISAPESVVEAPIGVLNVGDILGTPALQPIELPSINLQPIEATPTPALEVSESSALVEPTSINVVESVVQEITEAATVTTEAAQGPIGVVEGATQEVQIGVLNVGDILGATLQPIELPSIELQPIEAAPSPTLEVSESSAPVEPTSTDVVENVVQETTEAATVTTKAAQEPTGVVGGATQDVQIGVLNVGDILGATLQPIELPSIELQPIEATPSPTLEVSESSAPVEPTSTDVVENVVQETTEAATVTTEVAQEPTGVVGGATQDVQIGVLNVGDILGATLQPIELPSIELQPIETTPLPALEVSESSAPVEPTSTDAVESVVQETTEAATVTTEAAQEPTSVVKGATQDVQIGVLNVGNILGAEATPALQPVELPSIELQPIASPALEVSGSSASVEPTSTDVVESVVQETTETATATTEAAQGPTDVVGGATEGVQIGLLNVGDILSSGDAVATPALQPIELPSVELQPIETTLSPTLEVSESSAPVEPTSTDVVESVVQETTEGATVTTEAIQGPTSVVEATPTPSLEASESSAPVEPTSTDVVVEATPTPPLETSESSAPVEPTSTVAAESVVQETTEVAAVTTEAAQEPTSVVEDATEDVQIGLLNVDGTLGSGNAETTSASQPTEVAPTSAPEVSQSSAPAEPTSTDAVENVEQKTTEATKEITGVAQEPTPVVGDATQSATALSGLSRRSLSVEPVFNQTTGTIIAVNIKDLTNSGSDEVVTINRTCALALILPHQE